MSPEVYEEALAHLGTVEPADFTQSRHAVSEFAHTKLGSIAMAVIVTRTWESAWGRGRLRGVVYGTLATSLVSILLQVLL